MTVRRYRLEKPWQFHYCHTFRYTGSCNTRNGVHFFFLNFSNCCTGLNAKYCRCSWFIACLLVVSIWMMIKCCQLESCFWFEVICCLNCWIYTFALFVWTFWIADEIYSTRSVLLDSKVFPQSLCFCYGPICSSILCMKLRQWPLQHLQ